MSRFRAILREAGNGLRTAGDRGKVEEMAEACWDRRHHKGIGRHIADDRMPCV